MKILFVSDIHGCLPTLQQVLSFYDREHYDMLCILGDILNYGPRNRIPKVSTRKASSNCLTLASTTS